MKVKFRVLNSQYDRLPYNFFYSSTKIMALKFWLKIDSKNLKDDWEWTYIIIILPKVWMSEYVL